MKQLQFPFPASLFPAPHVPRGRWAAAELNTILLERGAQMSLVGTGAEGVRQLWRIRLEVVPPVRLDFAFIGERRLPVPREGHLDHDCEFFRRPLHLAAGVLACQPGAEEQIADMKRAIRQVVLHLEALLVPRSVLAARAFIEPGIWWFVYEVTASDPSGRVAQLAESCPGLLIMARGLRYEKAGEVCKQIFKEVVRGRCLNELLDIAAHAWTLHHLDLCARRCLPAPATIERKRLARDQRQRIMRASPLVPFGLLLRPPPPSMVPEDIPRDPERNKSWYMFTSHPFLPWPDGAWQPRLSQSQKIGLSCFLSKQWPAICLKWQVPDRSDHALELGRMLESFLRNLLDYMEHAGLELTRETNADWLLEEIEQLERDRHSPSDLPLEEPL